MKSRTEFLAWGWLRPLPLAAVIPAIMLQAWLAVAGLVSFYAFCLLRMAALCRGQR